MDTTDNTPVSMPQTPPLTLPPLPEAKKEKKEGGLFSMFRRKTAQNPALPALTKPDIPQIMQAPSPEEEESKYGPQDAQTRPEKAPTQKTEEPIICEACHISFKTRKELSSHQKKVHAEVAKKDYLHLKAGYDIKSLDELRDSVKFIDAATFRKHVQKNRNDFASFVRNKIGDRELAKKIAKAKTKEALTGILAPSAKPEPVQPVIEPQPPSLQEPAKPLDLSLPPLPAEIDLMAQGTARPVLEKKSIFGIFNRKKIQADIERQKILIAEQQKLETDLPTPLLTKKELLLLRKEEEKKQAKEKAATEGAYRQADDPLPDFTALITRTLQQEDDAIKKHLRKKEADYVQKEHHERAQKEEQAEKKIGLLKEVLEKRKKELEEKEKELAEQRKKELCLASDLLKIKKKEEILAKKEEELNSEAALLKEKQEHLDNREQTNNAREQEIKQLEDDRRLLDEKEDELEKTVAALEADKQFISDKEDEVVKKVNEIEEDERLLDSKENEILKKIDELEAREKDIAEKEETLAKRAELVAQSEEHIQKIKEMKITELQMRQNLSLLEKNIRSAEGKIGQLTAAIDGKKSTFQAKEAALAKKDAEISGRETAMEEREDRLIELQNTLSIERNRIDDERFRVYMKKEMQGEKPAEGLLQPLPVIFEKEIPSKAADLYGMIGAIRKLLKQKRVSDAEQLYGQIEFAYQNLPLSKEEKRTIYYELLSLKADIRLAFL